jgi:hypothetical protein
MHMARPDRLLGSRKRIAALVGILVVLAIAISAGGWVGYSLLVPAETPETIYVYASYGSPVAATSPSARASASADSTTTAGATADASATPTATPAAPWATPTPLPNLGIGSYTNPWLRCGIPFHMVVGVINRGSATARPTTVRITDMYAGHATHTWDGNVPVLAAGGDYDASWDLVVDTACGATHTLVVEIDPGNLIPESDETNNVRHFSYVLENMPDLESTWIALGPADPSCGNEFAVTVIVHNRGGAAMPRDALVHFVDTWNGAQQASVFQSIPAMGPGESYTVHAHFNLASHCGSSHLVTVTIDSANDIEESNEGNNVATIGYVL